MADFYTKLNDKLKKFILEQKMFFTATAAKEGRINLSPKGMDTFRILSDTQVGYLSVTGSGNETAAHILADGRMTIMFTSFTQAPLILRLYGTGKNIYPTDPEWEKAAKNFEHYPGTRQIILLDIESIQTSCGYSIPYYEYKGERETLIRWAEQKGEEGIHKYWKDKNTESIDGLPTGLNV